MRERRSGRVPLWVLALIAVTPALVVSAFVLIRGDRESGSLSAASAMTLAGESGTAEPLDTPTAAPAPTRELIPLDARGDGPESRGLPVPEITAAAAVVVDEESLAVLYDRQAHERRAPASLTKIATAIVAAEHARLDEPVTSDIDFWSLGQDDASTMGLLPGDELTLRELLYGLLLVSGNDAARVIARHVSGSEEAFVAEMNELVARLGLEDTRFTNPDGIFENGHYSSAWDLAIMARYLMRFPDLREIVGTETHTARGTREGEPLEFDLYNHNPLLNYTFGVDGVKTGFTEEAGRTFVVSAAREGHRVYVVLLDSPQRAQDSQALIEWAFMNHRWPGQPLEAPTPAPTPAP